VYSCKSYRHNATWILWFEMWACNLSIFIPQLTYIKSASLKCTTIINRFIFVVVNHTGVHTMCTPQWVNGARMTSSLFLGHWRSPSTRSQPFWRSYWRCIASIRLRRQQCVGSVQKWRRSWFIWRGLYRFKKICWKCPGYLQGVF